MNFVKMIVVLFQSIICSLLPSVQLDNYPPHLWLMMMLVHVWTVGRATIVDAKAWLTVEVQDWVLWHYGVNVYDVLVWLSQVIQILSCIAIIDLYLLIHIFLESFKSAVFILITDNPAAAPTILSYYWTWYLLLFAFSFDSGQYIPKRIRYQRRLTTRLSHVLWDVFFSFILLRYCFYAHSYHDRPLPYQDLQDLSPPHGPDMPPPVKAWAPRIHFAFKVPLWLHKLPYLLSPHSPSTLGEDDDTDAFAATIKKLQQTADACKLSEERFEQRRARILWWSRSILCLVMLCFGILDGLQGDAPITFAFHSVMISLQAPVTSIHNVEDHAYDSDSFIIAIDNCSSRCITNNIADFISPPTPVNLSIKGIAGTGAVMLVGTVRWSIEDDLGQVHHFVIPNTYYHQGCPYRLLSPQHWSDSRNEQRGSCCTTYFDAVELFWNKLHSVRTIYLDPVTNVALVRSSPGFTTFRAFCAAVAHQTTELHEQELMCMPALPDIVTDDESSDDEYDADPISQCRHPDLPNEAFEPPSSHPEDDPASFATPTMSFDTLPQSHVIPEDEEVQGETPQAELLAWHYRLGHISFRKIQAIAARNDLPRRLMNAQIPLCASCAFGKATRKAWRTKAPVNGLRAPAVK